MWYIYAFIASIFFSIYYVSLKRNLYKEHTLEYLTLYTLFLFLIILPFYSKVNFNLNSISYILIFIDALFLSLYFYFLTTAYRHLEVSEVEPLSNSGTLLIIVISLFLFKDILTLSNSIGILFMLTGVFILETGLRLNHIKSVARHLKNRYLKRLFLAMCCIAIAVTLDKIVLNPQVLNLNFPAADIFTMQFFTRLFISINFLFIMFIFKKGLKGIKHGLKNAGIRIFLASLAYTIANLTYYKALSMHYSSLVISVTSMSTLYTTIIGGELFHEHRLKQKIFAAVLMIIATYLIVA